MSESKEILALRAMAWERAKGELNSYLQTYWPFYFSSGEGKDNGFAEASDKISKFIEDFEGSCR